MPKIKTEWNLKLLYKSDFDPAIEKDLKAMESAYSSFEKKYKGKDFTSSPEKLFPVLQELKSLEEKFGSGRPYRFFSLKKDLNSSNSKAQAKLASFQERFAITLNKIAFFKIELGKISPKDQEKFLNDPSLKDFIYLLRVTFEKVKYNMTEGEEKLANLLSGPAYSMWLNGQEKLMSEQTIEFKGELWPIEKAMGSLHSLPVKERRELNALINKVLKNISHFAEAEINAAYNYKKIIDERRGYKEPFSATVQWHEMDEKTVANLASIVTKWFKLSQRFYKLHAKLLGLKKITHADRAVLMGKIDKKLNFFDTVELAKKGFAKFSPKFAEIFESYLENGQIDVYPRQGKRGGAYCSGAGQDAVYVLLNHTDDVRSAETLAHEMGHAFHNELSKSQPPHYRDYSTAVAEVASTLFENFILEEIEEGLNKKEKVLLLHNKTMGDMATIFRQIAFFNFEVELHKRIRAEGFIAKEEIAKLFNKHLKSYMGDALELNDDDGYAFVHLGHMRWFFYVYTYAFGQLVSRSLYEKWREDKSYAAKIEKFLSAGGSMSPKDIFKSIGIDTTDPKFFEAGLNAIEKDVEKLEKLTNKRNRKL
jgi:oligoendopeptidase F